MRGGDWFRLPGWVLGWLVMGLVTLLSESAVALAGFCLMTLLPPVGLLLTLPVRKKLRLRLHFPALGTCAQSLTGTLEATNPTCFPVGPLLCRITLENRLTGQVETVKLQLHPGTRSSREVKLQFCSHYCGYIKVRVERVRLTDLTGLLSLPLPIKAEAKLTALPELLPANIQMRYPACTPDDGETWLEGRKGSDNTEILQLRDYVPGDSIRQIHWKLSSKLERTIVREPSFPVSRSLLILWDKTVTEAQPAQMHAMAQALFAVCQAVSGQGFAYTLAWNDGTNVQFAQIQTEEDLLQTVPRLLKSGCRDAEQSALSYLPELQERYSKTLYFAAACPAQTALESFAGDGAMTIFLCGDEDAASSYRTVCYTPETCLQMLQTLELEA